MNKKYFSLLMIIFILNISMASGCWDYGEINDMMIVAGVAVDYDKNKDEYILTIEGIENDVEEGAKGEVFQSKGKTVFDAIRNMIKKVGRKLYWAHASILIIGKDTAENGIIPIIDLFLRGRELDQSLHVLICEEQFAEKIPNSQVIKSLKINSYRIEKTIEEEENLSKYLGISLWNFVKNMNEEGISPTLPIVRLKQVEDKKIAEVLGMAVFKGDKFVGKLDEKDAKFFMMIRNELKGGILTVESKLDSKETTIALEVLDNKTKVKPLYQDEKLIMKIDVQTTVRVGEIGGEENFIDKKGRETLSNDTKKMIEASIQDVIAKVQKEYRSDIFGFGSLVKNKMPKVWKELKYDWDRIFSSLEIEVNVDLQISSSGLLSKPIEVGD